VLTLCTEARLANKTCRSHSPGAPQCTQRRISCKSTSATESTAYITYKLCELPKYYNNSVSFLFLALLGEEKRRGMSQFGNDSFLEEVVNIESQAYEQGRAMGIAAAWAGDMLEVGCKAGFNKTYPMGLEIGFIEASERFTAQGALTDIASSLEATTADITAGISAPDVFISTAEGGDDDSGGGPSQEDQQLRKQRRKEQLLRKINMLPAFNSATVNYEAELHELRTLYRLNGSKMGKFLPLPAGSTSGSTGSSW